LLIGGRSDAMPIRAFTRRSEILVSHSCLICPTATFPALRPTARCLLMALRFVPDGRIAVMRCGSTTVPSRSLAGGCGYQMMKKTSLLACQVQIR
jgi:hypothetical protein